MYVSQHVFPPQDVADVLWKHYFVEAVQMLFPFQLQHITNGNENAHGGQTKLVHDK